MRRVGQIATALVAAVACGVGAEFAFAQWAASGAAPERYLLFSGFDLWRSGGSIHGGLLWSRDGLNREGLALKLLFAGGTYRYRSAGVDVVGENALGAALPGWRLKHDRFEIVVYGGLDVQHHRLTPDDLGNRLRGTHFGLRGGADVWFEPTPLMMMAGSVSLSTIGGGYWTRAALGWRFYNVAWVGPEALALGDSTYRQFRVGLHATSFRTGPLEWSLGLGFVRDSDDRSGGYLRIGVLTRQ